MPLFHFSEDPGIRRFEPHVPAHRTDVEPLVWAIDEWHAPMYFLPRDCPRACFWPGTGTTAVDRERWFGHVEARMVIAIESGWLERLRGTTLYRYTLPERSFELRDRTAGHWVSRSAVEPTRVEPLSDLLRALAEADVELRITPRLVELWHGVVRTSLAFSGTRLKNARDWREPPPL